MKLDCGLDHSFILMFSVCDLVSIWTVIRKENILILEKYTLKYLKVKGHGMCNLISNVSGRISERAYRPRERERERSCGKVTANLDEK